MEFGDQFSSGGAHGGGRGVIEDDDPCCKRNTNLFDVRMEVFAGMTMVGVN